MRRSASTTEVTSRRWASLLRDGRPEPTVRGADDTAIPAEVADEDCRVPGLRSLAFNRRFATMRSTTEVCVRRWPSSRNYECGIDIVDGPAPGQGHRQIDLAAEVLQDGPYAALPVQR